MVSRRNVLKSGAALGLFTLAGCAPQGTKASSAPTTPAKSIDVAKAGTVTLTMLDFWGGDAASWVASAVKGFQAKYPNVTIKRTSVDWGQLTQTANLRLKEKNPPDIITVNNGWQSLGTLSKAGLVLNLDGYSKSFGWDKFPSTILRQTQFTPDGTEMGSGSLFATPVASSSLIGLYYNKTVLDKAGVAPPTDLASFEDACTKAKAAGIIPIGYGSQDKGSSTAILLALQDLFGDQKKINDFVYSTGEVKAADIGMSEAAERLKSYQDKGWLTPNHAGIQYADAIDAFLKGKSAFRFEYTGTLAFKGNQKQEYGYVQLPQASGGKVVGTGASTAVRSDQSVRTRMSPPPSSISSPARKPRSTSSRPGSCPCSTTSRRRRTTRNSLPRSPVSGRSTRTTDTSRTSTGRRRRCSTHSAARCNCCSPAGVPRTHWSRRCRPTTTSSRPDDECSSDRSHQSQNPTRLEASP
ncbi:ABC transporter substrate-binding protein [Kribbella pratensis]|uniref:Raffinose/stachyose/melibiose transport system substrate-binding protein n=1 Tax=Kribbella pratensis TaxID=2512112 RepID=A0A4R8CPH8_9ACTN|nr:ABC transporter substrate-binding protein [Kribbella pratensis]TDW78052.1 raffinose/stachyose/melibiose transport system substrate-binding protein [Kribbella pratensis]